MGEEFPNDGRLGLCLAGCPTSKTTTDLATTVCNALLQDQYNNMRHINVQYVQARVSGCPVRSCERQQNMTSSQRSL
jgi:hypothetical protein